MMLVTKGMLVGTKELPSSPASMEEMTATLSLTCVRGNGFDAIVHLLTYLTVPPA